MNEYLKRTWAVINLDNLEYNINQIKNRLPKNTKIMGVVKADAYGHGDRLVSQTLIKCGVDFLAVSNLQEALSLRNSGIECDILILGFTPVHMAKDLSSFNITQTVFSVEYAKQLNAECESLNIKIKTHIKVDTGMGRIGIIEDKNHSATREIIKICKLKNLINLGIFTHLSSADSLDTDSIEYTKMQIEYYERVVNKLAQEGYHFTLHHVQNSAGISFLSNTNYDYARAGIIMYGVAPSNERLEYELKPVMELKSVVSMVKEIDANTCVSYGRKFISNKKRKIATVPIGYADGYPRLLSNKGYMLINGRRANIIGNICMDQLMLDISDIEDVKMGDTVTVVGKDGNEYIGFDDLSHLVSSISYEMMCLIGKRVPRVYTKGTNTIAVVDYIQK